VGFLLAALTCGPFSSVLGADEAPFGAIFMGKRGALNLSLSLNLSEFVVG
jgi:hypothetical protein